MCGSGLNHLTRATSLRTNAILSWETVSNAQSFHGEDPLLIADLLEETIVASSYEVWAIVRTVDQGVPLGKMHQPDLPFSICGLRRGDRPPFATLQKSGLSAFGTSESLLL